MIVTKPTAKNTTLAYTGREQSAGIAVAPRGEYNVTGDRETQAGDYIAKVVLDTATYMWTDGTSDDLELPWSIAKAAGGDFVELTLDTTYSTTLKLSDLALPEGYAWADSTDTTVHLSGGAGQSFAADYTPDSNHAAARGNITVNVAKASGLIATAPAVQVIPNIRTGPNVFDLSSIELNPDDYGELSYILGAETDGGEEGKILRNSPTITGGNQLNYQGVGKTVGRATQVIVIRSQNYEDVEVTVVFEATARETYAVTVSGGGADRSTYPAGDTAVVSAHAAAPGKVFDKWTTADGVVFADSGATPTTFIMPAKAVAVTAVYRDTSYTIIFDAVGGTVVPASGATGAGGKLASLPAPKKTGYAFAGWYTAETGGAKVDTSMAFASGAAVYARWTLGDYTVTWNANGGSPAPTQVSVTYVDSITAPDTMTRVGYTFIGWYADSALTSAASFPIKSVASDTTLYAKWAINNYSVLWHTNGGTPLLPLLSVVSHGGQITAPPPTEVTKAGYLLDGWCIDSSLATPVAYPIIVTADMALYAKWTQIYTVTFNPNGGAVDPASGKTGAGGRLDSLPAPTRSGYRFDGWYTELTGGSQVSTGTSFNMNSVIHARWTLVTYTVYFFCTDGDGCIPPPSAPVGTNGRLSLSSLPTPTRSNPLYVFGGWYTTPYTGGTEVNVSTVFTADTYVYTRWIQRYIITFNANGGTVSPAADTTGTNGRLASLPVPAPGRNGYAFSGWYTAATDGTQVTTSTVFTANGAVYARWIPVSVSYTITFNPNGGTVSPTSRVTGGDGTLVLPTPTRSGYAFDGWYTAASGGAEVTAGTVFEANATVYARWTPVYTVTFNANSGTVSPASAIVNAEGLLASLPEPTRAGYAFDGWYTTASTGGVEILADHVFTASTTIYARWTLVTYTVFFDANGGSVSAASGTTGTGGRLASLPTPAARTGYTFNGWYTEETGGVKVTTSTVFNDDATVYAQWSPIYTVTFDAAGGVVSPASANTGTGGKLASLPTPTRKDYTFAGWYTESEDGARITTSTVFDDDAVIYARWTLFTHATATFDAGANGTLKATVDGAPIASGDSVRIGKDVVFTAVPNDGYKVARWTINGTTVADTVTTYVVAGLSNVTTVAVVFERRISVASPDREIPVGAAADEAAVTPVKALSGAVTVGPNPVKAGGEAAFYWTGGKAVSGSLSVFDAMGQKVAAVEVGGTKKIGAWKVGAAAEGTYLVRGVLTDKNGVKAKVSLLVGVAK